MGAESHKVREAVVLCLELEQQVSREAVTWNVLVSRPSQDGVVAKSWRNHAGRLSAPQAEDLEAWCTQAVHNSLLAWGGIQGTTDGS